jgi:hypothetical protein
MSTDVSEVRAAFIIRAILRQYIPEDSELQTCMLRRCVDTQSSQTGAVIPSIHESFRTCFVLQSVLNI